MIGNSSQTKLPLWASIFFKASLLQQMSVHCAAASGLDSVWSKTKWSRIGRLMF